MAINIYTPFNYISGNRSSWTETSNYYLNERIYTRNARYSGLYNLYYLTGTYTFSIYVKTSVAEATVLLCTLLSNSEYTENVTVLSFDGADGYVDIGSSGQLVKFTLPNTDEWYRLSMTVSISAESPTAFRAEMGTENATLTIAAPMLEVGSTLHDFVSYELPVNLYPPFFKNCVNWGAWSVVSNTTVEGQPVYRKQGAWGGLSVNFTLTPGIYTYSEFVNPESATTKVNLYFHTYGTHGASNSYRILKSRGPYAQSFIEFNGTASAGFTLPTANTWYRISATFEVLEEREFLLRLELSEDGSSKYIKVSAPFLEKGERTSAYVPYYPFVMTDGELPHMTNPYPLRDPAMAIVYPKSVWRIESGYNDGYPFNELIPDIPYNPPPPPPPPAPTIDPVEFYDEYNAEYLSALHQKHRRYKVRLELLGYYENVVGEITRDLSRGASGSITINNEQITRRSCSLSLINVEKKYLPSPDSPIWFNRKFKLWIGIVTGKHTYWWSYGVFFTTKATCDGATLNIQGVDKGGALDGTIKTGMLDAENIIERGTTLTNVIKDTLMWNEFSSPYLNHNTGSSSYPVDPIKPIIDTKFDSITTQAEITINANDYISTLFSSIADGYGADAYYNTNGHFVFQTMADSSRIDGYRFMSRQWNFADTDEMYSNASIEYNLDGFNVVTVYTNESTLENVSYTAANNNPASPLRLDSAGIRRMSDIEIPYVNVSQDEMEGRCKAYADYLLMKEAMKGMSITFNCPILPHLDVNRTIGITDKWLGLEDATFVVNSITMPLGAESMTINATQFDWLPDDLNIEG